MTVLHTIFIASLFLYGTLQIAMEESEDKQTNLKELSDSEKLSELKKFWTQPQQPEVVEALQRSLKQSLRKHEFERAQAFLYAGAKIAPGLNYAFDLFFYGFTAPLNYMLTCGGDINQDPKLFLTLLKDFVIHHPDKYMKSDYRTWKQNLNRALYQQGKPFFSKYPLGPFHARADWQDLTRKAQLSLVRDEILDWLLDHGADLNAILKALPSDKTLEAYLKEYEQSCIFKDREKLNFILLWFIFHGAPYQRILSSYEIFDHPLLVETLVVNPENQDTLIRSLQKLLNEEGDNSWHDILILSAIRGLSRVLQFLVREARGHLHQEDFQEAVVKAGGTKQFNAVKLLLAELDRNHSSFRRTVNRLLLRATAQGLPEVVQLLLTETRSRGNNTGNRSQDFFRCIKPKARKSCQKAV